METADTEIANQGAEKGQDEKLKPGDVVGEYVIEAELGSGGFGTVYRANHPVIGKSAAVKVLSRQYAANREMVSRFISEARAVNTIQHANIIDIFSFGTRDDGSPYFVMELLEGAPLDAYLDQHGPLEPKVVAGVLRGVARALDAAHAKDIIHRDLKPDNIFLSFDEDNKPVPKLLDFGIAKLLGDGAGGARHKTQTGIPIGTPSYMAPEQCLGNDMDRRVDVYAFGVVCFEALTGSVPFDGNSYLEVMTKHTSAPRPPVSSVLPSLGKAYDGALRKMMALDRNKRPASVGEAWQLLADACVASGHTLDFSNSAPLPQLREQLMDIASAPTVAAGTASNFSSASAGSSMSDTSAGGGGKRIGVLVAAVALGAAGAFAAVKATSGDDVNAPIAATSVTDPARARAAAVRAKPRAGGAAAEATVTPSATAEASTSASAAASAEAPVKPAPIDVKIRCNVVGAVAYDGESKLGKLPGTFALEGAEGDTRSIAVKAPGHHATKVKVVLQPGADVLVTLKPIVRAQPRVNPQIESPDF